MALIFQFHPGGRFDNIPESSTPGKRATTHVVVPDGRIEGNILAA
jgi:hypothetical protein